MKSKTAYNIFAYSFLTVFLTTSLVDKSAYAAVVSLNSVQKKVSVGDSFRVYVYVNTQAAAINDVDGTINFPSDMVSVSSINTNGSIFSMWPQQPTVSNGTIMFTGGAISPGYTGTSGKIFSFLVKAKKTGVANFTFSNDIAVRADDGLGTNVFSGKNNLAVSVMPAVVSSKPVPQNTPVVNTLTTTTVITQQGVVDSNTGELNISSRSHPNQNSWYSKNSVDVSWDSPFNFTGVQYAFSQNSTEMPTGGAKILTSAHFDSIKDGIWYFRARYSTPGGWSPISTYVVRIDTVSPNEVIANSSVAANGNVKLSIQAADVSSGIDYFTVNTGDNSPKTIPAVNNSAEYVVPAAPYLGSYTAVITATDKAGNTKSATSNFTVTSLAAPVIKDFPAEIVQGQPVVISGNTNYANRQVSVFVKLPDLKVEQYLVDTDKNGGFKITTEETRMDGYYEIWAQYSNERGEKSFDSLHVKTLAIISLFSKLEQFVAANGVTILLSVLSLIGFISMILYPVRRMRESASKRKIKD